VGYTEIEVGFPVASEDDYTFVRQLIERDLVADDVRISVLVPARDEAIRHTVACLEGARKASIHLYNATCPTFRDLVFGMTRDECKGMAVNGTRLMMKYSERALAGVDLGFQYSPELFNETEPEFALEVCEAVIDVWQPEAGREIVLNFPATVERTQPNVFADRIEWMDRRLSRREHVCLSIHPHNDRGTGVASAELALLAGAQRVEGCLFGGGERAGNVCLVTLGLNLFSQGIDPEIDFSDLDRVRRTVEYCNRSVVHDRHPYAGDLVYTAFSGSHQDAIKKGFDAAHRESVGSGVPPEELDWRIPYLPIDPRDVGRDYEAVVRVNSQSGKGGVAYVLGAWHGFHPPRPLQIEFARIVQAATEEAGGEIRPAGIGGLFRREYFPPLHPWRPLETDRGPVPTDVYVDLAPGSVRGPRAQAVETLASSLIPWGIQVDRLDYTGPPAVADELEAPVVVYVECRLEGGSFWGAGVDQDIGAATFSAVRAAAARAGGGRAFEAIGSPYGSVHI
jgi:2-isopropylmalate synthase